MLAAPMIKRTTVPAYYPPFRPKAKKTETRLREYSVPDALEIIVGHACRMLFIGTDQLRGSGRHHTLILARRIIIACAKKHTLASYPDITKYIRDHKTSHTTSLTAHRRFNECPDDTFTVCAVQRTQEDWLRELERSLGIEQEIEAPEPC